MERTMLESLAQALDAIDPSLCDYDAWLRIGMGLHAEQAPFELWDAWSRRDVARYRQGECARKWAGFSPVAGGVTGATIFALARKVKRGPTSDKMCNAFETKRTTGLPDTEGTPEAQLRTYLSALFRHDEFIGYVCDSRPVRLRDGTVKYRPASCGVTSSTAGDLMRRLASSSLEEAVGAYDARAGAWIRINPLDGKGARDANVSAFRHALVESDEGSAERQLSTIENLGLPVAAVVHSGGKSVHAVVKIDARTAEEYRTRVATLYDTCVKAGLAVDQQNRNPSRLSRLPGAKRGDRQQTLICVDEGCPSWDDWILSQNPVRKASRTSFPPIEQARHAVHDMPPLSPPLIEGVLRQGHKMLLAGPSKAGKSFALIELCMALSTGTAWLGASCARGRVLYVNLEVDRASCLHRMEEVRRANGFEDEALDGIDVWNLRGRSYAPRELIQALVERAAGNGYCAVVIDPLYKLLTGDENSAHDMADLCSLFDWASSALGAAIVCCHHHSKGSQGWKAAADRASGSGVLARDADALLDLLELDIPDEIRRMHGTGNREATAWRIESTLREFPAHPPLNVWFDHPLHRLDESGELAACLPKESLPPHYKGGRSTKARHERENETKAREVARVCEQLHAEKNGEPFMIGDLISRLGWSRNTVKKHLDAAEGWKRIELNENTTIVQKCG